MNGPIKPRILVDRQKTQLSKSPKSKCTFNLANRLETNQPPYVVNRYESIENTILQENPSYRQFTMGFCHSEK